MPGIAPAAYFADKSEALAYLANSIATYPKVDCESRLRCYARLTCKGKKK